MVLSRDSQTLLSVLREMQFLVLPCLHHCASTKKEEHCLEISL